MPRIDSDYLRSREFQRAAICVLDVNLAPREESNLVPCAGQESSEVPADTSGTDHGEFQRVLPSGLEPTAVTPAAR